MMPRGSADVRGEHPEEREGTRHIEADDAGESGDHCRWARLSTSLPHA